MTHDFPSFEPIQRNFSVLYAQIHKTLCTIAPISVGDSQIFRDWPMNSHIVFRHRFQKPTNPAHESSWFLKSTALGDRHFGSGFTSDEKGMWWGSAQIHNCPRNCERRAMLVNATVGHTTGRPSKAETRESGDLPRWSPFLIAGCVSDYGLSVAVTFQPSEEGPPFQWLP